jgi:Pyridoxamine 5'-phosphate oxidase
MDPHEVRAELARSDAQELLHSPSPARLAYNGPDGLPRVSPVGFLWNGEQIIVCSATTSPKVRALTSRPDVALTIDVGNTPADAKALNIRGHANVEIVDGIPDEYIQAAAKSLGEDGVGDFEHAVREMYEQMARIMIDPQWARMYDFGAGRLPPSLTALVHQAQARAASGNEESH